MLIIYTQQFKEATGRDRVDFFLNDHTIVQAAYKRHEKNDIPC